MPFPHPIPISPTSQRSLISPILRVEIERKHVDGGALFGVGWAVAGTCPGPAIGMAAAGGFLGLVVMAGLGSGILLRNLAVGRFSFGRDPAPQANPSAAIP